MKLLSYLMLIIRTRAYTYASIEQVFLRNFLTAFQFQISDCTAVGKKLHRNDDSVNSILSSSKSTHTNFPI